MTRFKKFSSILIFLYLSAVPSFAQQTPGADRFGLGAQIGYPSAVTGKYWTAHDHAIDFGMGFWGYNWVVFYADFHWYFPGLYGHKNNFVNHLLPYMGVGGGAVFWGDRYNCSRWGCDQVHERGTAAIFRVPFGTEWFPVKPPLGVYVELVPTFTVIPTMGGGFDFGAGARYYF